MHLPITVGKPLVLRRLQHSTSGNAFGTRFKKGTTVILPGPKTPRQAAALNRARAAAHKAGAEMARIMKRS